MPGCSPFHDSSVFLASCSVPLSVLFCLKYFLRQFFDSRWTSVFLFLQCLCFPFIPEERIQWDNVRSWQLFASSTKYIVSLPSSEKSGERFWGERCHHLNQFPVGPASASPSLVSEICDVSGHKFIWLLLFGTESEGLCLLPNLSFQPLFFQVFFHTLFFFLGLCPMTKIK